MAECKNPGGGLDPDKQTNGAAYSERKAAAVADGSYAKGQQLLKDIRIKEPGGKPQVKETEKEKEIVKEKAKEIGKVKVKETEKVREKGNIKQTPHSQRL